jgi:hypothetical protein
MFRGILLVALLLTMMGCGTVGPVQPLLKSLPQGVENVTLAQKGAALLLAWDIPTRNQDDTPLTDLAGFAIYKSDYDLARGCPECRPAKNLLRKVDLAYYRSNNRQSQRVYLWDSAVEEEMGYRYKIVPYTADGHEGAAVLVHRPYFTSAYPPLELSGVGLDSQVRLTWSATSETRQGVVLLGYNVYRRSGKAYFSAEPLNTEPIAATSYDDLNVTNTTEYTYAVRTVVAIGEQQLESAFSTEVMVTPHRPE